jgi:Phosphotransferase enzyme family
MDDGVAHLASIIAAHLREWDTSPAFVELAIFESDDARVIAAAIDAFCARHLGARVAGGLFHQSSIGSVTGAVLSDGRRVVIKAHQPDREVALLAEIARIQSFLAARRLFAAEVVAGPLPLGQGHAIVESYIDIGTTADAHRPEIRRALARGLRAIVTVCEPLVATTRLVPALLASPLAALWPTPHSRLFDFDATAAGAEWIDAVARLARERMAPAGVEVIGHGDWRQEHVRFVADEPVAAFDWDSLCRQHEPALLGCAAHGFCADWSRNDRRQAPTLAEARAFIGDYETARGSLFSASERQLCAAAFAYSCAYTARCGHALGKDERGEAGTFAHLVWTEREELLAM